MKAFSTASPRSMPDAIPALKGARASGKAAMVAGGGSDLLGTMKERLVTPDVVVRLAAIREEAGDRHGAEAMTRQAGVHGDTDALVRVAEIREMAGYWEGAVGRSWGGDGEGEPGAL